MKQSVIYEPQNSRIEQRPMPEVGPNDVLVQVKACGVCASELHGWQGDQRAYPKEYGHEAAGEVIEVGAEVKKIHPGMRVTGLINKGYAEYARGSQEFVTEIPDGIPFEHALGEPLGCIFSGARRTNVELGDSVAVIGLGFMGLLMLQALKLRGAVSIIAVDPREDARQTAVKLGADQVFSPSEVPDRFKMVEWEYIGKEHGVNVSVEASGTPAGLTLAGQMVREHGILSIVGWHQGGPRQVDMEMWNWKAFDVVNAHERRLDYMMNCMRRGLALMATGQLQMAPLITHRFGLDSVDQAFRTMVEKPVGYHKGVIVP
jgi:threonine dehydrogenase-like Zn-dependent dehydrogenase